MKLNSTDIQNALEIVKTAPETAGLPPEEMERFLSLTKGVLEAYGRRFGEEADFSLAFRKHLVSIELKITVPGKPYDPLLDRNDPTFDDTYKLFSRLLTDRLSTAFYIYGYRENIISIRAPRHRHGSFLKSPTLWAALLGILFGFLSRMLPTAVFDFLINEFVSPAYSILVRTLSGVTGPLLFLSLISSITTLSDISELNTLGRSTIRHFVITLTAVSVMSILVCALFFRNLGGEGTSILPDRIIALFLDMIPTNLFSPFVEGKIPQLIVLGLGMGAALLMIGERGNGLKSLLGETSIWLSTLSSIINKAVPAITFLNLMNLVASGRYALILEAWKYIVAFFLCMLAYALWKLFFVSFRHSLNPLVLLKKLKPLVSAGSTSGNGVSSMKRQKRIAEEEFGIQASFSDFWMSMSYAMLNPTTAVTCVASAFCAAKMSGVSVSVPFLVVLLLLSVQVSIASPGLTSSLVIIFGQLGLSTDYVGIFTTCKIVTGKIAALFSAYSALLEELNVAFREKAVDESILFAENTEILE